LQLEPEVIGALRSGAELASDVPTNLRGVRCYRLTVGNALLPRSGTPPAAVGAAPGAVDITTLKAPAETIGWRTLEGGGFECILQLDAAGVDQLAAGKELRSELPAFLHDVRTYRITLGTKPLPRSVIAPAEEPAPSAPPTDVAAIPPAATEPTQPAQGLTMRDPMIRQASAEMPPSLAPTSSAAMTDAAANVATPAVTPSRGIKQTVGYTQAGVIDAAAPTEAGSPSVVSPPLSDIIPRNLTWREPYTFALIALFTSVAMNLYLGWVTWNASHRYRRLRNQIVGQDAGTD
jgi:hypothetical protein